MIVSISQLMNGARMLSHKMPRISITFPINVSACPMASLTGPFKTSDTSVAIFESTGAM